jgi:hypothetical protein
MQKPQGLVSYGFQYNTTVFVFILKLPLPSHGAIFPGPMHTVKTTKHPRESPSSVNLYLFL